MKSIIRLAKSVLQANSRVQMTRSGAIGQVLHEMLYCSPWRPGYAQPAASQENFPIQKLCL